MNLTTQITKMLGIKYPIIQAGMAGSTTPELVSTVSKQGGLGMIGAGYFDSHQLSKEILEVQKLTQAPFAVNLFTPNDIKYDKKQIEQMNTKLKPYREALGLSTPKNSTVKEKEKFEDAIEVIESLKVPIIAFTFGIPNQNIIKRLHNAGKILIGTATSVEEAVENENAGMDIVVAQGYEAGGHRGSFTTINGEFPLVGTLSLVPQIVDNVSIPVIAAGDIMDGRGLVASLALGAGAAQLGTAYLTTNESGADDKIKNEIIESSETDTILTNVFSGKLARGIMNEFVHNMNLYSKQVPPYPLQNQLTTQIRKSALEKGYTEWTHIWSGQSTRLADTVDAAQLTKNIINDAVKIINNK
ncbi:TPA: nitronate monooxygenase [Staphylococcus aureus]|nr:nitronate monooxygenase [Staphylococcus aureus]